MGSLLLEVQELISWLWLCMVLTSSLPGLGVDIFTSDVRSRRAVSIIVVGKAFICGYKFIGEGCPVIINDR